MSEYLTSELDARYDADICSRCGRAFPEDERERHPSRFTSPLERARWRCGEAVTWQQEAHAADAASVDLLRALLETRA